MAQQQRAVPATGRSGGKRRLTWLPANCPSGGRGCLAIGAAGLNTMLRVTGAMMPCRLWPPATCRSGPGWSQRRGCPASPSCGLQAPGWSLLRSSPGMPADDRRPQQGLVLQAA